MRGNWLIESLADDVDNRSHFYHRCERHVQNYNKGAFVQGDVMLMICARQRDGYLAVHNAVIANAS